MKKSKIEKNKQFKASLNLEILRNGWKLLKRSEGKIFFNFHPLAETVVRKIAVVREAKLWFLSI